MTKPQKRPLISATTGLWLLQLALMVATTTAVTEATQEPVATALENVSCPSTQRLFTGVTEIIFAGRTDFLTAAESDRLAPEFIEIYNGLSESNCDANFRRITQLRMLNATNSLGQVEDNSPAVGSTTSSIIEAEAGGGRFLQSTVVNTTTTGPPTVVSVYEVTGTCRGCPLTNSGSFNLYDDGFRRGLHSSTNNKDEKGNIIRIRTRLLSVQDRTLVAESITSSPATTNTAGDADCQCIAGVLPTNTRAPGVKEVANLMNTKFDAIRQETASTDTPLFQNIQVADLVQADDLTSLNGEQGGGDTGGSSPEIAPTADSTNAAIDLSGGTNNTNFNESISSAFSGSFGLVRTVPTLLLAMMVRH